MFRLILKKLKEWRTKAQWKKETVFIDRAVNDISQTAEGALTALEQGKGRGQRIPVYTREEVINNAAETVDALLRLARERERGGFKMLMINPVDKQENAKE